MAIRPVLTFPHPILKTAAAPCPVNDHTRRICQDLVDTMESHQHCVGLAAPQIGLDARIMVVDVSAHPKGSIANHGRLVLINPRITDSFGFKVGREGCLSLPEITANVGRAERIAFTGLCPDGAVLNSCSSGFEARALQHELDHLDGILILDRVASPSEIFVRAT